MNKIRHALSGILLIAATPFVAMAQEPVRSETTPPASSNQGGSAPSVREMPLQPPMGSGAPEPMLIENPAPTQPPIAVAPAQAEFRVPKLPVQPPISSDASSEPRQAQSPLAPESLPNQPPMARPTLR